MSITDLQQLLENLQNDRFAEVEQRLDRVEARLNAATERDEVIIRLLQNIEGQLELVRTAVAEHIEETAWQYEADGPGQVDRRALLSLSIRRLQKLQEQAALHGPDTSPSTLIEIEDLEARIKGLTSE